MASATPQEQPASGQPVARPVDVDESQSIDAIVDRLRDAVRSWSREDQLHDHLGDLLGDSTKARPILTLTIRDERGLPAQLNIDLQTWTEADAAKLLELVQKNTAGSWLKNLRKLAHESKLAWDFYDPRS